MLDYKPSPKLQAMLAGTDPITFTLHSVLTNSVFYPNADVEWDIDGDPLRLFATKLHSFVYTCQNLEMTELAKECRAHGCGGSTILVCEEAFELSGISCHWSLWKYQSAQEAGIGFSLLVLKASAETAFHEIYGRTNQKPTMACVICKRGATLSDLPQWFSEANPEYVLYGGFDKSQGAYDSFYPENYRMVARPQAQTTPGAGTSYAFLNLFHGCSWEKSPEEGGLPRYPSRGMGKRLRLFRRNSSPNQASEVTARKLAEPQG